MVFTKRFMGTQNSYPDSDRLGRMVGLGTIDPVSAKVGVPPTMPQGPSATTVPNKTTMTAPGYSSELHPDFHHRDPFDLPIHRFTRNLGG